MDFVLIVLKISENKKSETNDINSFWAFKKVFELKLNKNKSEQARFLFGFYERQKKKNKRFFMVLI